MSKKQLSKFMSGLLRHFPDEYDLQYDSRGWFELDDVVKCVNNKNNYSNVTREDIINIVNQDEKGRYEIDSSGDLIRAVYGHSIDVEPEQDTSDDIPDKLYHGTPERNKESIMNNGLLPQNRQKVHLTDSKSEARSVGLRHTKSHEDVVLFVIDTKEVQSNGFDIQNPTGESVYTVSKIPSDYISVE